MSASREDKKLRRYIGEEITNIANRLVCGRQQCEKSVCHKITSQRRQNEQLHLT